MKIIESKIKFIISNYHECQGYKQAYIVASSKGSYETAIAWAKGHNDSNSYEEYETDNKDFQLSILESANGSSQGGKLSFWNCLVKKDDKEFVVGILAKSLCELFKNTTWINGVCQDGISFFRTTQIEIFKTNDVQQTVFDNLKKTTKWEIGKTYGTRNISGLCIGDIYVPFQEEYNNGVKTYSIDFDRKMKAEYTKNIYAKITYYKKYPSRYELPIPQLSKKETMSKFNNEINDSIKYYTSDLDKYYTCYSILNSINGIPYQIDKLINYYNVGLAYNKEMLNTKRVQLHPNGYMVQEKDNEYIFDNYYQANIKVEEIIISNLERIKREQRR